MINIRLEEPFDIPQIYRVNRLAFGQAAEANLVIALRNLDVLAISLATEADGEIVGHIAFSPVMIESKNSRFDALGLGPMAVLPGRQNRELALNL